MPSQRNRAGTRRKYWVSEKVLVISAALAFVQGLSAETGYEAWLRYVPIEEKPVRELYDRLPAAIVLLGHSAVSDAAGKEVERAVRGLLGRTMRIEHRAIEEDMLVMGTLPQSKAAFPGISTLPKLGPDGYWLKTTVLDGHRITLVAGQSDRGVLYGTFALLREMALHRRIDQLDQLHNPRAPIRWVNQWDNLDGSVERGYAGRSIFFEAGKVRPDMSRVSDYGRLLASVGINGCTVNNVNADPRVLSTEFVTQLVPIADAFRPWGVRLSLSVDFSSPKSLGGLATFDPLDPAVAEWWRRKADEIYRAIPDFAGFVLKADSEGRLGPSVYGRTHADAANVLAQAVAPHGGVLVYRAFVYNHHLDWRNLKNDRARAAYDNFHPLDGAFKNNVLLQIKYGPIDFQAREPVSPLIAGLEKTNELLELQITQEYTGQQRHLCFLIPMWKQILDLDMQANGAATPVKQIVTGRIFHRPLGGFVGVANVGRDLNWLGSDLAMANLYGFGRIAWNPDRSAEEIADEWTRLTFGNNADVVETIQTLQLESWHVYEGYTGPFGLGTLTDILHSHYGPGIETAERNGWGQWIRADHQGIGMDRSTATGTGYISQYPPALARGYESLASTPDSLLLFMHHVPYTYLLHSGKTVIQYVYDSHYEAAAEAQLFPEWWAALRGRIDEQRYKAVLAKLNYQAGHAIVWRDAICNWFLRESGLPDKRGRAGHYPDRIEAEAMKLSGYALYDVRPWEDASGGKAVTCRNGTPTCTASFVFDKDAGWYDLSLQYFDLNPGQARFKLFLNEQEIDQWVADLDLPSKEPKGDTSVRRVLRNVALRKGDRIQIEGTPEGGDSAALDYAAVVPAMSAPR